MKKTAIKLLVTLVMLMLIFYIVDVDFKGNFLSIQNPYYLIFALIIPTFIIPIIVSNRWKAFLEVQGISETLWDLAKISFKSIFLGLILPSSMGFDAIRIYMIEKRNRKHFGSGGASIVIERIIGLFVLSFLGVIGSYIVFSYGGSVITLYAAIMVNICSVFIVIIIKNKYMYEKINKYLFKVKKGAILVSYLTSFYEALNQFPFKKILLKTIPLILLFQFSTIICCSLVFKAYGIEIPFYFHLAFLPLIAIITIIPVTLSGFGLREGGFVYFYGLVGVDGGLSITVSVVYYLVLVMVPAFIGMIIYIFDNESKGSIKRDLKKYVKK